MPPSNSNPPYPANQELEEVVKAWLKKAGIKTTKGYVIHYQETGEMTVQISFPCGVNISHSAVARSPYYFSDEKCALELAYAVCTDHCHLCDGTCDQKDEKEDIKFVDCGGRIRIANYTSDAFDLKGDNV